MKIIFDFFKVENKKLSELLNIYILEDTQVVTVESIEEKKKKFMKFIEVI